MCLAVAVLAGSCGKAERPSRGVGLPQASTARQAVAQALHAWQEAPDIERTTTTTRPLMFVEQQQPPGQRLLSYELMGETPGYEEEGYRRFLVRLSLADPEASVLATYYVFGTHPIWVYRAEDFEMIMHMDKSMMPAPPPSSSPPVSQPNAAPSAEQPR